MLECRSQLDIAAIRGKFYHLANTKKPNGDLACSPPVRRTKNIASSIIKNVNAFSVGDDIDEGEAKNGESTVIIGKIDGEDIVHGNEKKRCAEGCIGSRKQKRKAGAAGVNNAANGDEIFVEYMGDMMKRVSSIVDSFQKTPDSVMPYIEVKIIEAVQKEVNG